MSKRILTLVVALVVIGLLYLGYQRYMERRHAASGDITIDGGRPEPVPNDLDNNRTRPVRPQPAMQTATAPASDSIPANPANGAVFSGSGKFQVYRQGSLTWRVDTESGRSCVLFATLDEWRKPLVYSHGCGNA